MSERMHEDGPPEDMATTLREMRRRLAEAEETVAAIRSGAVDAFVIDRGSGARVYTIEAADRPYRLLVESMQQGAAMLLADGTVLFANPRLGQLLGCDPQALCGRSIVEHFPADVQTSVQAALRIGVSEPVLAELVVSRADGTRVPVQWTSAPMPIDSSVAIGIIITDLTERRQHEAVRRTSERLQAMDRKKDEFLATLAHELRNPLAPIMNAVEILRSGTSGARSHSLAVGVIDRQVRLLVRLVDDLLDLGRINTGQVILHRRPVRIDDVLRQAVEISQPLLQRGGHDLEVAWPDRPAWVHGDENRLAQVFSNLLNNAAVYSPQPGVVRLHVSVSESDVCVAVTDQGIGIAESMLERVFEMFTQANPGKGATGGGLGIGLSLVRSLVELHGGRVSAASDGLGTGARFEVTLPLTEAPASLPSRRAGERSTQAARARVLVVDDNEDAAVSLGTVLESLGVETTVVHDGESAVTLAQERAPDVVLLDLGMPGLDGYETCRRLRQSVSRSDMRIVALTGWGMDQDRERTYEAGFDLHLVKPVHPAVIVEHIRSWRNGVSP